MRFYMVDNVSVELDEHFLKKFFGLTDRIIPEGQAITLAMLRNQLDEIELELKSAKSGATTSAPSYKPGTTPKVSDGFDDSTTYNDGGFNIAKKSILIIDDLGVI